MVSFWKRSPDMKFLAWLRNQLARNWTDLFDGSPGMVHAILLTVSLTVLLLLSVCRASTYLQVCTRRFLNCDRRFLYFYSDFLQCSLLLSFVIDRALLSFSQCIRRQIYA